MVTGPCWTKALPARPSPRLVRKEGLRWPRFVRRGFSLGVGGGLGLPSESSTLVLVRFASFEKECSLEAHLFDGAAHTHEAEA